MVVTKIFTIKNALRSLVQNVYFWNIVRICVTNTFFNNAYTQVKLSSIFVVFTKKMLVPVKYFLLPILCSGADYLYRGVIFSGSAAICD